MVGLAGLEQHPPAAGSVPDGAGGAGDEREGLLGGAVARRQQLLVEVEEGGDGDRSGREAVQDGLGADGDAGVVGVAGARRDLRDGLTGECFQLLAHPGDTGAQVAEPPAAAGQAHDGALGPAHAAAQHAGLGLGDRSRASIAGGDLAAGPAGEQARPAETVEHAHDTPARRGGVAQHGDEPG